MENICFYCSSLSWGGLEMNVVKIAARMKKRGWNIFIYCAENSKIKEEATTIGLTTRIINRNRKYYDFINAYRVYKQLKKDQINLLWVNDTRDISLAGLTKTFSVNTIKVVYQQCMQIGIKKRDLPHTIRFSKIDAWIPPLHFLAEQIKKMTRFNPDKIHVIPSGLEIEKFKDTPLSKNDARKKLNLPTDRLIIGVIGRFSPFKGQYFLIEAIHQLKKENISIDLLIVGESTMGEGDAHYESLKKMVKEYALEDVVHFRPFMKEVINFYKAIDIFVMASKGETFGMVTIEAMMSGTPIIGTNSAGTPEILDFGKLGSLYQPEDLNNFCEQLKPMLQDKTGIEKIAKKAQEVAQQKFSSINECEEIEKVLAQL